MAQSKNCLVDRVLVPRCDIAIIVGLLAAVAISGSASAKSSRVFVTAVGEAEVVRDWERQRCDHRDTPDTPPRAFRDSSGLVHFFSTESTFRQFTGPSLDDLTYHCDPILKSAHDDRFESFQDRQWLVAPYTLDGRTIYSLVHNEYHGHLRPQTCPSRNYGRCWGNVITLAISRDGGRSFQHLPQSERLVAMPPYKYVNDYGSPIGYFQPSNIVQLDGYFYTLFRATPFQGQKGGVCVMRTSDLADPASWRAWDGTGFNVRFLNPYVMDTVDQAAHVCQPLRRGLLTMGGMARDERSGDFVLVMQGELISESGERISGIWATTSRSLIDWATPTLVWKDAAGAGAPPIDIDPALLDPTSRSLNFETFAQRPYIYFVRFGPTDRPYNRKLLRVPVKIEKR